MPLFLLPLLSWGKSALSFFARPPGSYIGAAAILALSLWWFGQHYYNKGHLAAEVEAQNAAIAINTEQPKIIERLRTIYVPAEAKIKTITQTVIKEVPVYVTKHDDSACVINNGFVRVHDAAATGELPGGPTGTDGEASPVKLSTVAETVTGNYGTCHIAMSRLTEWQDWYRQNKALWTAPR